MTGKLHQERLTQAVKRVLGLGGPWQARVGALVPVEGFCKFLSSMMAWFRWVNLKKNQNKAEKDWILLGRRGLGGVCLPAASCVRWRLPGCTFPISLSSTVPLTFTLIGVLSPFAGNEECGIYNSQTDLMINAFLSSEGTIIWYFWIALQTRSLSAYLATVRTVIWFYKAFICLTGAWLIHLLWRVRSFFLLWICIKSECPVWVLSLKILCSELFCCFFPPAHYLQQSARIVKTGDSNVPPLFPWALSPAGLAPMAVPCLAL